MSLHLAQKLAAFGTLPARDLEAGLIRCVKFRVPLLAALAELRPHTADAIACELQAEGVVVVADTAPDLALVRMLPDGMCSALLAFPIGVTASTGVVDVLACDPTDPHIEREFAYQLKCGVRVLGGRIAFVFGTAKELGKDAVPRTQRQDGAHMNEPLPEVWGEAYGAAPADAPRTRRGVAPPDRGAYLAGAAEPDRSTLRPPTFEPPREAYQTDAPRVGPLQGDAPRRDLQDSLPAVRAPFEHAAVALERLPLEDDTPTAPPAVVAAGGRVASAGDGVAISFARVLSRVAREVHVFARRDGALQRRVVCLGDDPNPRVETSLSLSVEQTRVLGSVMGDRPFVGQLPDGSIERHVFVDPPARICALSVTVGGKTALVALMSVVAGDQEVLACALDGARRATEALSALLGKRL